MTKKVDAADEADASLGTQAIEEILADWLARKSGVEAPYVRHCKWVWLRDGQGRSFGPTVVVKVSRAPDNLVRLPAKRDPSR